MAEIKTTRNDTSPAVFIKQVDGEQRRNALDDVDRDARRALVEHSVAEMRKRHPTV